MNTRHRLVLSAEVSLTLVTLAAVVGMSRLFSGGGWLAPLALTAVAAHATAAVLRRRGVSLPVAGLVMAVAAFVAAVWMTHWSTTVLGVPLGDSVTAMRADLNVAWITYQEVKAPAEATPGFLLASAAAIWFIAYVADWAAFRLWVPFEATLPASTLFLFTALLGVDRGRGWTTALYASAMLAFLLLHRMAREDGSSHWVAERQSAGHHSLLVAGGSLAAVAVLAGALVGPALPGAGSPGVIDAREIGSGGNSRLTISPMVELRLRLVEQSATEVFTVRSSQRSYWRLTSLNTFDGDTWTASRSFGNAGGTLGGGTTSEVPTESIDQVFTIKALAAIWLPNAFEPQELSVAGVKVRYHEDSSTLIVDNAVDDSDGLVYRVTSASPRLTDEQLATAAGDIPGDIADDNLDLPGDFSPRVRDLAEQVTRGATTPAEQARALQDYLRDKENFTYSLEVQKPHDEDLLEHFLFESKTGYCEQFAGAYAAMARSLGLPARVAVGFTTGVSDPDDPDLFHVLGEHAHAWPEVYLAGVGRVMYEPTPNRGAPNSESYTGVPEQQSAGGPGGTAVTFAPSTTTPSTIPQSGGSIPQLPAGGNDPQSPTGSAGGDPSPSFIETALVRIGQALGVAAIVLLLALIIFPTSIGLRRWHRRRQAVTLQDQVELAWIEAVERAELVGYREIPSETYPERAARLARVVPAATDASHRLARTMEAACYSPEGADETAVATAQEAAARIRSDAWALASRTTRLASWLDPRRSVAQWRTDRSARQRQFTMPAAGDVGYSSSA